MAKFAAKIFLVIFGVLLIQFIYFGLTSTPASINESDSLAYHIPIAQNMAKLNFLPPSSAQGLGYYPAAAELILSLFVLLHLPLNLFGVLGFMMLFLVCFKVGESFGLGKERAIIYAGSVATLQSVLRWPLTQTVDIWLAVFFLAALYFLKKGGNSVGYYLKLGISLGLLVGTKFSGILFCIPLLLIFGKNIFKNINLLKLLSFLIPVTLLGLSWYIRNYILTGNPLYPANFLFLKGSPGFPVISYSDWTLAGNVIKNPRFFLYFLQSLNTEFLFWSLSLIFPIYVFVKHLKNEVGKLSLLGFSVFAIFVFILPYWVGIDVSNLRFLYPAVASIILSVFLFLKDCPEVLLSFSLITAAFSITNMAFHPKIILFGFAVSFYLVFLSKWKSQFV